MALPFVSRGRYDDAVKERDRLREENRRLLDRLFTAAQMAPLYERPASSEPSATGEEEGKEAVPTRSRPTLATIRSMAEAEKRKSVANREPAVLRVNA